MRRSTSLLRTLALLVGVLALCACEHSPHLSQLSADATVVAFGDSLTHGNGAPAGEAYPDVLAGLLGVPVINAGVPGETTSEGLARLPKVLEEDHPDLLILCEGGNDFLRRQDQTRLFANLRAMVVLAREAGAEVVLVGVPQLGLFLDTHPGYEQLAEELKLPYEGEIVAELLSDRDFKSDTIHPNVAGYRRMAEAIYAVIDKAQR